MTSTTRLDQPRPPKEPSMDEILASIRKIIADDVPLPDPRKASPRRQEASGKTTRVPIGDGAAIADSPKVDTAPLLSPAPQAEAAASFASLNHTVFSKNARTVEDLVQDMLRPMLQTWLDAHLPTIVERLVRQEIERISGLD